MFAFCEVENINKQCYNIMQKLRLNGNIIISDIGIIRGITFYIEEFAEMLKAKF